MQQLEALRWANFIYMYMYMIWAYRCSGVVYEVGDLYGEVVASRSLAIQRRRQQHLTLVLADAKRLLVVTIYQSTINVKVTTSSLSYQYDM